jgi:hypothetical protein
VSVTGIYRLANIERFCVKVCNKIFSSVDGVCNSNRADNKIQRITA